MIWFGTPKITIHKKPDEYDRVQFNPHGILYFKYATEDNLKVVTVDGDFMYGMYYIKMGRKSILDEAIFEAKMYDASYYAHVLTEMDHHGCFMKIFDGYLPKFKNHFETTKKELMRDNRYRIA